jgi:hypothetical protein
MRRGTVIDADDQGTIWRLIYKRDGDLLDAVVFDHRSFANFYEGVTGASFFEDYTFGHGRDYVSSQLRGLRVAIDGEPFNETVRVED